MDLKKIQHFNSKMGRPKYSKGGYIKKIAGRKYFDDGGAAIQSGGDISGGTGGDQSGTTGGGNTETSGLVPGITNALGLQDQFQAGGANITGGTNSDQLNAAYNNAQSGLTQQQNLTNTLTPQTGSAVNNQNQLAQQELAMSQGAGPNPAQNQLAQATGTNVANQAALAAGQRGGSANVGLQTRQAAQTGAATQQAAAGQAATLGAQQQIAAQQNLAGLSSNQISQTGQAVNNLNSANQNEQSTLQNANTSYNNAAVGMQSNMNNVNSQTAAANQNMNANVLGGIGSAISSGSNMISSLFSKGGEVGKPHVNGHKKLDFIHKMAKMGLEHFDGGGDVQPSATPSPKSFFGLPQANADTTPATQPSQNMQNAQQSMDNAFGGHGNYDDGGQVDDSTNEGTFKASDASASAPSVASTSSLPADTANLSQSFGGSSGGGGGGGGGGAGALMALMADGGPIQANPLIQAIQNSPTNLGTGSYSASSSSGGPNVASTPSLPKDETDLSKSFKKQSQKPQSLGTTSDPTDPNITGANNPLVTSGQADPEAVEAGGYDSSLTGDDTQYAAKGGEIWNIHPSQHGQYAAQHFQRYFAKGGESKSVPAMVSPGERYWNPREVEQIKHGADPMKLGKIVPGKDKVPGKDSLKNDTVPATLEEGGIVNPLHVEKTKNSNKARLFVLKSLRATGRHLSKPRSMS